MRWISDAGGIAVIAHPARYKFTPTEEYALFTEFKAHGGRGVEVVTGSHSAADAAALRRDGARVRPARLARQRLPQPRARAASTSAACRRCPDGLTPVWEALERAHPRARAERTGAIARRQSAHVAVLRSPPDNPQPRLLKQAAQILHAGGIAAIPTDSSYALVCHLDDKAAAEKLRRIRGVDDKHHLTLLCRDLSRARELRARRQQAVPAAQARHAGAVHLHPRGDQGSAAARLAPVAAHDRPARARRIRSRSALLDLLGQPLLATTLIAPGETEPMNDPDAIRERFEKLVQAIVDAGACPMQPTTVVDLTGDAPVLVRLGRGDPGAARPEPPSDEPPDGRRLTARRPATKVISL